MANVFTRMGDSFKSMIRNWLQVQPAINSTITLREQTSYQINAYKNRLLFAGDPSELEQFFMQTANDQVTKARFWASRPSKGNNIRKMHSGLPAMMVNTLSNIVASGMQDVEFNVIDTDPALIKIWEEIAEENKFKELITQAIEDTLVIGDGAFKISFDTDLSQYPIIEFYPGDKIEYIYKRGRLQAIRFYTEIEGKNSRYTLEETYSNAGVTYRLFDKDEKEVSLSLLEETRGLQTISSDFDFMFAVPLLFDKSPKYEGRGKSIFDAKTDSFDALDETVSQWQDAIRLGRIKRYIPISMIPRDPNTGAAIPINTLDNQYIGINSNMGEDNNNNILTDQPAIQYEGYINTYINNLDMCLQGIISPSTLGIDTKKLDNAEAQREKEKTTLYTRQNLVSILEDVLPKLVDITIKSYQGVIQGVTPSDIECTVEFAEYANPSFEAQVETVGKASSSQIMSVETQVETLWGDSKDEEWKKTEILRLKSERGIAELEEPVLAPNGFEDSMIGDVEDEDRRDNQASDRTRIGDDKLSE